MKNEFALAFNEVLEEKQLPKEIILNALESAMVSAYRRSVNASNAQQVEAKVDPDTGKVTVFAEKEIVESVNDDRTEVTLEVALTYDPDAELGGMVMVESTPENFGRVAAQTARQVIQQRIRDAERQSQLDFYAKQVGEIVSGVVQAVNAQGLTVGLEMRSEAVMSRKDMIPRERFHVHDRVRALIAEVKDTSRGPQINLSRTHRDFLRRLLETEVPEIYHGVVEIRSIAREPGERAKVAVSATQSGIDPVGACVGMRGVRIQAIVRELHDEKIDVIEWNDDASAFIAKALSPARVLGVYLSEDATTGRTATVVVPEDQLSLAIGRDGQNARLAAKLTSWRIDIKSLVEAAADELHKLQTRESLSLIAEKEQPIFSEIEDMLARKSEGRPLGPEEYDKLFKFVDRIEKAIFTQNKPKEVPAPVKVEPKNELRDLIQPEAFEINLLDSGLPEHIANILQGAGYLTVGDIALQMKSNEDSVLGLDGIGAKSISKITDLVNSVLLTETAEEASQDEPTAEAEELVETASETKVEAVSDEPEEITIEEEPAETVELEPEEDLSFEELFNLKADIIPEVIADEDSEEEDDDEDSKDKKKKKKRKHVEIVYDPEKDLVLKKKKHKRGDGLAGWDDWDL